MTDLRTDIIEVYIVRVGKGRTEFLQLMRTGEPAVRTWQPVMGHAEPGETAIETALREVHEEVGLTRRDAGFTAFYGLEEVHPYFLAQSDCIMLSPCFAAMVAEDWEPKLNDEHTSFRWVPAEEIETAFLWPGQRASCREIMREVVAGTPLSEYLRVEFRG
jgi:dihydroneopterin triphosphate diphosphatase